MATIFIVVILFGFLFDQAKASIRDEFSGLWPHQSGEMERRSDICRHLLSELEYLSWPGQGAQKFDGQLVDRSHIVRWFIPPQQYFEWQQTMAKKPPIMVAMDRLRKLFDLDETSLQLKLMADDLEDPMRRETRVPAGRLGNIAGPAMVSDGEFFWPYQWHAILSVFSRGDLEKSDQLSQNILDLGSAETIAHLLMMSLNDIRLGYGRTANYYLSYEITRAEIMIARTWYRLGNQGKDILKQFLKSDPSDGLQILNLLEIVYPLRWQVLLPELIELAKNSTGEVRDLALLYLIQVHRRWIDLYKINEDLSRREMLMEDEIRFLSAPHPLKGWQKELSALAADFFPEISSMVRVEPAEKRDMFRGAIYGGLHMIQRYLKLNDQIRAAHPFPEYDHSLDYHFHERRSSPHWEAYYQFVVNRMNHDFNLWHFNRKEFGSRIP